MSLFGENVKESLFNIKIGMAMRKYFTVGYAIRSISKEFCLVTVMRSKKFFSASVSSRRGIVLNAFRIHFV